MKSSYHTTSIRICNRYAISTSIQIRSSLGSLVITPKISVRRRTTRSRNSSSCIIVFKTSFICLIRNIGSQVIRIINFKRALISTTIRIRNSINVTSSSQVIKSGSCSCLWIATIANSESIRSCSTSYITNGHTTRFIAITISICRSCSSRHRSRVRNSSRSSSGTIIFVCHCNCISTSRNII